MSSAMRLNLAGTHAILSPSSPAWINYDTDKMTRVWHSNQEARRGSEIHDVAAKLIKLGIRLPQTETTLNMYVNDAIGYRMTPEELLFYSENCYGHCDAYGFRHEVLRIHDLKTGINEANMTQLVVYAALFCLEFKYKPSQIKIVLRIYQNDDIKEHIPDPDEVFHVMDKIITFDKLITYLKTEV